MRLENIVWDTREPQRLGRFWAAALGAELITDEPDGVEARLHLAGPAFLDLCFPRVDSPSTAPARLHLDLAGGARAHELVQRLLDLGAERADTGQGAVPRTVLTDLEGNAFRVLDGGSAPGTGPVAALPLDSADPERDAAFWAVITGWTPTTGTAGAALRHPSGTGPVLELRPEPEPKRGKNRLHLDVRRGPGDDDVVDRVRDLGAVALSAPGELPWLVFSDPSGNEFCILEPERS